MASISTSAVSDELEWNAPGPGRWRLDADHADRPIRRAGCDIYTQMGHASATGYQAAGLPTERVSIAFVNGWPYVQVTMVDSADELARREDAARATVDEHAWRDVVDRWFNHQRKHFVDRCLGVQRQLDAIEATASLDEAAAVLSEAAELAIDGPAEHFRLTAGYIGAGLFLEQHDPGDDRTAALAELAGASPASREAAEMAGAVADALGDAVHRVQSLDDITTHSTAAADALAQYLELFGSRSLDGYADGPILLERPELTIRSIQTAAGRPSIRSTGADRFPDDVRRSYALRDDNVSITCNWTAGLLQRAVTLTGVALHEAGRLDDPTRAFDLSTQQLVSACEHDTPELNSFAAAAAREYDLSVTGAPLVIDGERIMRTKPDIPPYVARASSGLTTYRDPLPHGPPDERLSGLGVGSSTLRGRAVVATDPIDALARVEPGDVLVTAITGSAFNVLLTQVAGLVTEHGGAMSHAALMARELDIPAVIGVADAMSHVPDGALVELDAADGSVRVLDKDVS